MRVAFGFLTLRPNFAPALVTALLCLAALGRAQGQDGERIHLGKLGQAVEAAKIYRSPSKDARSYYTVKEYDYLVINDFNDTWLKVLMTNGKQGFIDADVVAVLPYNVSMPKPSGSTSRGDINRALNYSFQYIGTPYKWGGTDIQGGIDCSAFVKDVFDKIGVDLPRTAAEQYKVGKAVTRYEDLEPGDRLYFWDKKRGLIGHTGIFTGKRDDGGLYFIHSSSSRGGVATDDLRNPKWNKILVAARR